MNKLGVLAATAAGLVLTACANHPVDCAIGFYHSDCLPGTAGYDDPNKFAAADDATCKSYGLTFGSEGYGNCRMTLTAQHQGKEPNIGFGVVGVTHFGK